MHARGLRLRGVLWTLAMARPPVLPSAMMNDVGTPVAGVTAMAWIESGDASCLSIGFGREHFRRPDGGRACPATKREASQKRASREDPDSHG